jgi:hypothetical protein
MPFFYAVTYFVNPYTLDVPHYTLDVPRLVRGIQKLSLRSLGSRGQAAGRREYSANRTQPQGDKAAE